MICCYMLYAKQFSNAYDSMRYYGLIRTKNKKVTLPRGLGSHHSVSDPLHLLLRKGTEQRLDTAANAQQRGLAGENPTDSRA